MAKARAKKRAPKKAATWMTRRRIVVALVVFTLLGGGLVAGSRMWAQRRSLYPAVAPQPQPPQPTLSKEYIYAGGRLIATEEPTSSVSSPSISSLSPQFALPGSSSIALTISGSNLSNTSSINFSGTGITVSNINATPNQVTANISIAGSAAAGTRQVSVTTPGGTSNTLPFDVGNPDPEIISISPSTVQAGVSSPVSLTVNGAGFVSGSKVRISVSGGTAELTTVVDSPTKLTAQIPTTQLTSAGIRKISVFNPAPGGGASNEVDLTVSSGTANPIPFIAGISPSSVPAGSGAFTLTVTSNNGSFRPGAEVRVNNSPRATTYHSSNQLTASLTAADVAVAGTSQITVFNPAPGGGISNVFLLTVTSGGGTTGTGLRGEYFNNTTLSGTPVAVHDLEPIIDFNWGQGSPDPQINADQFSARWTGQVQAPVTGNYTFYARFNDGARLWVNNKQLVNLWLSQPDGQAVERSGTIKLVAGQKYDIRLEYFDGLGKAHVKLLWSQGTAIPKQVIPTSQLFPPQTSTPPPPPQPLYQGVHEGTDCTTIFGWAADAAQPNTSINVDIYHGSTFLATVPANLPRTGLPVAGNHGFSYMVPASLKDGQARLISVRYAGTSSTLIGSPQTLICSGTSAPFAPSNLTAVAVTASQINLTWRDNSTNENGFHVERKQGAGGTYAQIASTSAGVTSYQDISGLIPGVTYFYRVRAYNTAGASVYSNEASATIAGAPTGVPVAPSDLVATAVSGTRINLSWSDNSDNESGFTIVRKKIATCVTNCAETTVAVVGPNVTSYAHTNLTPSTLYCYRVVAFNDVGNAGSGHRCATTLSGTKAAAVVSLFSGDGAAGSNGYQEGAGPAAKWRSPATGAIGIDPVSGLNALFVADTDNHRIRMIYLEGPAEGHSILLAGSGIAGASEGGGDPFEARYNYPRGIAVIKNADDVVDAVLIADTDNHTIRMLLPPLGGTRWRPETFSGKFKADYREGTPQQTYFNAPYGITIGNDGFIYVADSGNGAIRRLDWDGNSSTLLRRATWKGAAFTPIGISASAASNWLYITSHNSHSINRVEGDVIDILSSATQGYQDGNGALSRFNTPYHLIWSDTGGAGSLYIVDLANNRIRQFDLQANQVTTIAGSGTAGYQNGTGTSAKFQSSTGIAIGSSNELYIVETGNHGVRKVGEQ